MKVHDSVEQLIALRVMMNYFGSGSEEDKGIAREAIKLLIRHNSESAISDMQPACGEMICVPLICHQNHARAKIEEAKKLIKD